ncbi:NAD(P)/FAD-dependent oxidoreductase [Tomitella fengzijianii]|uniref:Ferredoxin--NADP reductase n=1 Tax=Tomitella fengzijianii TaxID=2597660 RepID=A0A516WZ85_9ACTN|nr:NAD(P)/FAD-dependent oxidoreductase [Tomitella fengzijianii]QDQ96149.1 NAD(P)/FAD-dependent oxidoreductase [Tomitella fengzijianii]
MTAHDLDILIVGAGPVGLYGVYYAGVRGLKVGVIDSLSEVGGQVSALYPEKQIFDIAGYPRVKGRDLVAALAAQAAQADPVYLLGQEAQELVEHDVPAGSGARRFTVTTSTGDVVHCGAIVLTAGIGTFTPRKLPAGEEYLGRGLEYFVPDPLPYAGSDVVIVGGGDSALDWALMLEEHAKSVTVVHRRKIFRAHAATVAQVEASTVRMITDAEVVALTGGDTLADARVRTKGTGDEEVVACGNVVAALGFLANIGPLREWGIELRDNRHIVVDSAMRTTRPGIFSAGDITEYDGKVRLISVGFGEVATAVNNAAVHLDPDAQLFPGHSTDEQPAPEPATA